MIWLALLLLQQPPLLDLPPANPYTSPADLEQGRKLYLGRCAGCHGPAGDGGKGSNLAVPVLPRASEDRALYTVIRFGIPDTEMPRSLMAPREIWQVAAYVRSLGRIRTDAVPGDPARGAELVRGKGGCLACHAIGLEGGVLGPSLSAVGLRRSPAYLASRLLDPSVDIPEAFRMAELTTVSGRAVSGVRLNEDTYSIQVRDLTGALQSFWKSDLVSFKTERKTPMPSYRARFTDSELQDAVAFLVSLRGQP